MISRDLVLTVANNKAALNEPITLYKQDRGIVLNFEIKGYKFKFNRKTEYNLLCNSEVGIVSARVLVVKPDGTCFEIPMCKIVDDIVSVTIGKEWIDEDVEVGTHKLQIQLYGENPINQRITIPPVEFRVESLIAEIEETSDIVGSALADLSMITEEGEIDNSDLENGIYDKTVWTTGDIITSHSLNKIENAVDYSITELVNVYRKDEVDSEVEAKALEINVKLDNEIQGVNSTIAEVSSSLGTRVGEVNSKLDSEIGKVNTNISQVSSKLDSELISVDNKLSTKADKEHSHSYNDLTDKPIIPSIEGLASETYVDEKISEIQTDGKLVADSDKIDYMGNPHETLKQTNDANVEYVLGEVNTVHYEGQHITATDTFEKQVKSAILKGQTLVNGVTERDYLYGENVWALVMLNNITIQPNKKYIAIIQHLPDGHQWAITNSDGNNLHSSYTKKLSSVFQTLGTVTNQLAMHINIGGTTTVTLEQLKKVRPMIIEYQEGMENWDIPYFTGMQSVKMPVLTTTGKNLFDGEMESGTIGYTGNLSEDTTRARSQNYITIDSSQTYRFINYEDYVFRAYYEYDSNKKFIRQMSSVGQSLALSFSSNTKYIKFVISKPDTSSTIDSFTQKIAIYLGNDTTTTYEPYKSNILTTPSDLVLRGIGTGSNRVEDELDCLIGEVTQRIGEEVLNTSNQNIKNIKTAYHNNDNGFYAFDILFNKGHHKGANLFVSDKLANFTVGKNTTCSIANYEGHTFVIRIPANDDGTIPTLEDFKKWLDENSPTVQYELATPTIKTVDLSDNVVYSYKDVTHYDCSSAEGSLVPTLSIDVPTSLSALVSRQRSTIEEQKEEITTLERQNETQDELINTTMLAIDEMFMMLEPLLLQASTLQESNSKLVDMYVAMVQRGLKTIDQVPTRYREQVKLQLKGYKEV